MQTMEPEHLKGCPIHGSRKKANKGTILSGLKAVAIMGEKQWHIVMECIVGWYIHIKQVRFGKGGAA